MFFLICGLLQLIKRGAQIDVCDYLGKSPLLRACEASRLDLVEALLDLGVSPNPHDLRCAHFPLQTAIRRNDAEIVKVSTHVLFLVIPRGFRIRLLSLAGVSHQCAFDVQELSACALTFFPALWQIAWFQHRRIAVCLLLCAPWKSLPGRFESTCSLFCVLPILVLEAARERCGAGREVPSGADVQERSLRGLRSEFA